MAEKKDKKTKIEIRVEPETAETEVEMTAPETAADDTESTCGCGTESGPAESAEGAAEGGPEEGAKGEPEAAAGEAAEDAAEAEESAGAKKKEKKDPRDEKIEDLNDRLMRQMAEFENYRKRTEKEKASMYEVGAREVLEKILPVVDNFERGLADADASDPFVDGMQKIYKQLTTTLEEMGVAPIESVGCEFDPNLHNAVMHVEDENEGTNTVTEEFQKGYTYKDTVIRYSMVKVAN